MASTLVPGAGEPGPMEHHDVLQGATEAVPEQEPITDMKEPALAPPEVRMPALEERSAPPPEVKQRKKIGLGAAIGGFVVAALLGGAIGYAAGLPQRNDLADQKDAALAQVATLNDQVAAAKAAIVPVQDQVTSLQAQLDRSKSDLATATGDLATAKQDLTATADQLSVATAARDVCRDAAQQGSDYADQVDNLFSDLDSGTQMQNGSAAEAQLIAHINEQMQRMHAQYVAMQLTIGACQAS